MKDDNNGFNFKNLLQWDGYKEIFGKINLKCKTVLISKPIREINF